MRLLATALALGLVVTSAAPVSACSIRGQFCGYPAWAANAFEHPRNRINLGSSPNLPSAAGGHLERPRYHARRAYHRRYKH